MKIVFLIWILFWGLAGCFYGPIYGAYGAGWFGVFAGAFLGTLVVRWMFGVDDHSELPLQDGAVFILSLLYFGIPLSCYLTGDLMQFPLLQTWGTLFGMLLSPWIVSLLCRIAALQSKSISWILARVWMGYGSILGTIACFFLSLGFRAVWAWVFQLEVYRPDSLENEFLPILKEPIFIQNPVAWSIGLGVWGAILGATMGCFHIISDEPKLVSNQ